ncbi:MAG: iron ABC transporter permease [Armatimonadota bacterium]|nr:iron ABC transporter permease [Armatimonadota bacterium]MDR7550423.1 iron ABC transporter permease [Armatimonadota bacterium]
MIRTLTLGTLRRAGHNPVVPAALVVLALTLGISVLYPAMRVLSQPRLADWSAYLSSARWLRITGQTLWITLLSTFTATAVGFAFAFAITRARVPLSGLFKVGMLMPLVAPPFVFGLSFLLLFGRRGLITYEVLGLTTDVYGWHGLWLVQTLAFFPVAALALVGVLNAIPATLEYAAQDLGARPGWVFRTVSLPLATPGLASAALLVAIFVLGDFGNPTLVGGPFKVLATEAYAQLTGWYDLNMAATLSLVLLMPTLGVFLVQRYLLEGRSYTTVAGRASMLSPPPVASEIRWGLFILCGAVVLLEMAIYAVVLYGAFASVWGVDWRPTLTNFEYTWLRTRELWNSTRFAATAAGAGSFVAIVAAYLVHRHRFPGRGALDFAMVLPAAVPGTLMGIGYILAFNEPPLLLTGTGTIITLAMLVRVLPVGYRSGVALLHQIGQTLEEGAADLGAPPPHVFRTIIFPLLRPAFVGAAIYGFIRSMNTLSSVVFLISPGNSVASASILALAEHGQWSRASAMAVSLMVISIGGLAAARVVMGPRFRLFGL